MTNKWENKREENKFFTVDQANELTPLFQQEIILLQELKNKYDIKTAQLYDFKRVKAKTGNGIEEHKDTFFILETEIEFIQIEMQSIVYNIESKGAILKDIDMGLIDFPTIIDGSEMELCWKYGEDKIKYYHGKNEGYYHRKPLEDDIQPEKE
ncbi:DUF2203 domain-containing protein [Bacillus horti]|uniref:DUF2203 family protein n=1 Tax=Caldalkalibacillus horti TaxID=77523 RepID=A0ABT9W2A8_9BACI|nr:DUF2203 domain-containing protein [Bacillus horti]MDQ0167373.1 hypothetical protein [Bacillus horti]